MKIKIWHIVLTFFILSGLLMYLLIQPYMFWFVAVKQPYTPGTTNKYYIYSANTSIFNFQKEFTYDWIAQDALFVVKDYDLALKYINECDKLNLKYKDMNTIRKFRVYMALKDYDNALKIAQNSGKFQSKFEMEVYIVTGEYQKAKEAYEKYWDEYSKKHPNYKNNPMKYFYLAQVEYSGKQYNKAYKAINRYFDNNTKSTYASAWQLKANIAKKLGKQNEYKECSKKVAELKEASDRYIKKSMNEMNNNIINMFNFKREK